MTNQVNKSIGGVNHFLNYYQSLNLNGQFFQLVGRDLEQSYPNQVCPIYWKLEKNLKDLDALNENGKKIITGAKRKN